MLKIYFFRAGTGGSYTGNFSRITRELWRSLRNITGFRSTGNRGAADVDRANRHNLVFFLWIWHCSPRLIGCLLPVSIYSTAHLSPSNSGRTSTDEECCGVYWVTITIGQNPWLSTRREAGKCEASQQTNHSHRSKIFSSSGSHTNCCSCKLGNEGKYKEWKGHIG